MKSTKPDAALTKALATIANLPNTAAPSPLDEMRKRVSFLEMPEMKHASVEAGCHLLQLILSSTTNNEPMITIQAGQGSGALLLSEARDLTTALIVLREIGHEWQEMEQEAATR